MQARLRDLSPHSDAQRQLQAQALQLSNDLALSRWLIVETTQRELPHAFLVVLLLWLIILYTCYGLIAPKNGTVRVVLFISALSIAGAIFLILEMNTPLGGIIKVSSAPMHKALTCSADEGNIFRQKSISMPRLELRRRSQQQSNPELAQKER